MRNERIRKAEKRPDGVLSRLAKSAIESTTNEWNEQC
jgi:hypothetical protein